MSVKTTFSFNELSEKAKDNARQQYRNSNDYYFESQFVSEDMQETLKDNDFLLKDKGLEWQLSYCQGDYVGISGALTENKLHEIIMSCLNGVEAKRYKFWVIDNNYIDVSHKVQYCHYYGQQVEVSVDIVDSDDYLIDSLADKIEKVAERLVFDYVDDLISKLKKDGRAQLDYYDSDEYIDDYYLGNDYEFDEEGNVV